MTSVACSTTQMVRASLSSSRQASQGASAVLKKPQTGQGVTLSAAWPMVRAMDSASPMCPWSIQRAMRSAPRVPMPGNCLRAATSSSTGRG